MLFCLEYCFYYTITTRVVIVDVRFAYILCVHGLLLVTCVKKKNGRKNTRLNYNLQRNGSFLVLESK